MENYQAGQFKRQEPWLTLDSLPGLDEITISPNGFLLLSPFFENHGKQFLKCRHVQFYYDEVPHVFLFDLLSRKKALLNYVWVDFGTLSFGRPGPGGGRPKKACGGIEAVNS